MSKAPAARAPATRPPRKRIAAAVTIHEVARQAAVSLITVSRAVNHPERVSPATLKRVREAIERTGYVPNLMAGGLRSASSALVVALVPTLSTPLFSQAVQSLTQALDDEGYQLMLGQVGYRNSREDKLLDAIIGRRPDGIVLTGIMHSPAGRRRLITSGIPVVETWDLTPTPIDMLVGFSHERIGAEVCEFLARRGRRRLALVGADDERALRRREGFEYAAARLGLDKPRVHLVPAPTTHVHGRAGLAEVLSGSGAGDAIDAVFCSSDTLAMGVLTEARARGLAVPEQLAVVGFGDLDFAQTLLPALTTVHIDATGMGRIAAGFIVARAHGQPVPERVVDIGFSIVERDSA